MTVFAPGALVTARGREWVVVEDADDDLVVVRSLGGGDDDTTAVVPSLESITAATFPPPVVTVDRGLAAGVRASDAEVVGPRWLLARLVD